MTVMDGGMGYHGWQMGESKGKVPCGSLGQKKDVVRDEKEEGGHEDAARLLVCVMAALLVVGLVPMMPEVPFALADEPEAVLELGDEILDDLEDAKPEERLEGDEETISVDADIMVLDKHAEDESDIEIEVQSSDVSVTNPRVRADTSMKARQVTTWDCVWFGSYPQTEIKTGDAAYGSLAIASWDANGDATVDGKKYHRISKDDATYSGYWSNDGYDSATYRYFRYEPVKWRVLKVSGTTALVVSDVALDGQRYNNNYTDVTWETSSVRSWLNGYGASSNQPGTDFSSKNFIDTAFSSGERSAIIQTNVTNANNAYNGTLGGNDTKDKVFLLSEAEVYNTSHGFVANYGTYDEARRCKTSDYAHAMGSGGRPAAAMRATVTGGFVLLAASPTTRPAWTTAAMWIATATT